MIHQFIYAQVFGASTHVVYGPDTTLSVKINQHYPDFQAYCHTRIINIGSIDYVQYLIELRSNPKDTIIQSIIDTSTLNVSPVIEFVDINLDGYLDIKLATQVYSLGSESYHFWTFDKNTQRFVFNKEFSELSGDLAIDTVDRTIKSTIRSLSVPVCEDASLYQVHNNHLKLIRHVWDEQIVSDGESKVKTFIEELVDGKMKLVKVIMPE
jgi:hypothetical protein